MLHKTCPTCKHQRPMKVLGFTDATVALAEELLAACGGHIEVRQWGHYLPRIKIKAATPDGGYGHIQPYDHRGGPPEESTPGVHIELFRLSPDEARRVIAALYPEHKHEDGEKA